MPFWVTALALLAAQPQAFRPPAVPLVAFDPYLSVWSFSDDLTGDDTRHWTHHPQPLISLVRVDGSTYRIMGKTAVPLPAMPQVGVQLEFLTPRLPSSLQDMANPVTYLHWTVQSRDGRSHKVQIFDSASSLLAVDNPSQQVVCQRETFPGLVAMRVGTVEQPVLVRAGDDTRIDWGYFYLAAESNRAAAKVASQSKDIVTFSTTGGLGKADDPRALAPSLPTDSELALAFDLGVVTSRPASCTAMLAYDEVKSIDYYGTPLPPYWRRNGMSPKTLLTRAARRYDSLEQRARLFDQSLTQDLSNAGGEDYVQIGSLAYRQFLAATGIAADRKGQPLLFTKENTSNGDIATVDVIFPMAPGLLAFCPALAKAMLVPVLDYAASPHWKFPNAPHDLGTYPHVTGRDDGGEGMPVEESGNMLILCDAIAQETHSTDFVGGWWSKLTQWERYLEQYGLDPEDQLCTDDFMGHLAHNANLSVKAILGIAAYADLAQRKGEAKEAKRCRDIALADARHWVKVADGGVCSLLAFDKPGTWSQKYNLVWDRILGLNIFPPSVAAKEVAWYKSVLQPYGIPLDSRTHLTKTDWSFWSASLSLKKQTFEQFIHPIWSYLNTTTAREPLVDSYVTDNIHSDGMHARPVVGGIFIRLLDDRHTWNKWAARGANKVGSWAPIPKPPVVLQLIPTAEIAKPEWRYTTTAPPESWTEPSFDDSAWQTGIAGFGTEGTPGAIVRTDWNTDDIWLRRTVAVPSIPKGRLVFLVYHDEDVQIYVNGVLAAREAGYLTGYKPLEIRRRALALLQPGQTVTLAVHCHQTTGGQGVDVGLAIIQPPKKN